MITLIKKYDDKMLVRQAERALTNEPGIDNSTISVFSKNGVVTLEGNVRNQSEHRRAIDVVRRAFERLDMKHDKIVDKLAQR